MSAAPVKTIGVTAFKAKCLQLVHEVATGETAQVILTKRGKPIANLSSIPAEKPQEAPVLWGALRGMLQLDPDFDLTTPTSELIGWDPDQVKLFNE